jgi:ATP-dependent DNA helicase DinG
LDGHPSGGLVPYQLHLVKMSYLYLPLYYFDLPTPPIYPYSDKRQNQPFVLNEIAEAYNSGYKHIILEAPTGFGKSAVAVAVALTMGSSYICTSTKDLQRQYSNDFPYLKLAKGKNNFPCLVKEDFVINQTYKCGICTRIGNICTISECSHLSVEYGPCMTNKDFKDAGCKYRTFLKDYKVSEKGTGEERISISSDARLHYQNDYLEWLHIKNFQTIPANIQWRPCGYFDQLNTALTASHSIFNYSNFLAHLPNKKVLPIRQLLVLDEGHLIETEIIKFRGLSIHKKRWKRYIQNFKMVDYGYNDIRKWIEFLIDIETNMLKLLGEESLTETLALERKIKYRFDTSNAKQKKNTSNRTSKRIISAPDLFDSDEEISKKYVDFSNRLRDAAPRIIEEIAVEAIRDLDRLTRTINNILADPSNWIVSEIQKEETHNNIYEVN